MIRAGEVDVDGTDVRAREVSVAERGAVGSGLLDCELLLGGEVLVELLAGFWLLLSPLLIGNGCCRVGGRWCLGWHCRRDESLPRKLRAPCVSCRSDSRLLLRPLRGGWGAVGP